MPLPGQVDTNIIVASVMVIFVAIMLLMFVVLLVLNYRRCGPNQLLVIYGKIGGSRAAKVVHGGAAFVFPLVQDYAYLSLEPMRVELPKSLHGRAAERGVKLPAAWTFAISTDPQLMQNAAIGLIGLPRPEIERLATDLIVGRIERKLDQLDNTTGPIDAVALVEKWAAEVDEDLGQVGLKAIC